MEVPEKRAQPKSISQQFAIVLDDSTSVAQVFGGAKHPVFKGRLLFLKLFPS